MKKLNQAKWKARECGRAKDNTGTIWPEVGWKMVPCAVSSQRKSALTLPFLGLYPGLSQSASLHQREIECLLNDNHQKGKMMIMIMKTSGSQVDSPVAEGKRKLHPGMLTW